jgi:glycogen debranching enzyme
MGTMDHWRDHFAEAKERGYTMLHYTPLQERGDSNSPYSIRDQIKYDPTLFASPPDNGSGKAGVVEVLKVAREEYGLLSLTDVVLNHTANNSPWLVEHPEAGRSCLHCTQIHLLQFPSFRLQPSKHTSPHSCT